MATAERKAPDPEYVLRTNENGISCFSDGIAWQTLDAIFSGSTNGFVHLWDMSTKRAIKTIETASKNSMLNVVLLSDNKILCHDRDGNVTVWNLEGTEAHLEDQFSVYQFGFCPVSVLKRGEDILVGFQANSDSQFNVMDLKRKQIIAHLKPEDKLGMVMHGRIFYNEETKELSAIIGYEDGSVLLWDVSNSIKRSMLKVHNDAVMSLDLDSECSKAVVGSADNKIVQLFIPKTHEENLKVIRSTEIKSQGIACLKIRPDGKIVTAGCWDGKVRVFGWKKLKPLAVLQYHMETVNCITYTKSNKLVCGSKDGKISIWSLY